MSEPLKFKFMGEMVYLDSNCCATCEYLNDFIKRNGTKTCNILNRDVDVRACYIERPAFCPLVQVLSDDEYKRERTDALKLTQSMIRKLEKGN